MKFRSDFPIHATRRIARGTTRLATEVTRMSGLVAALLVFWIGAPPLHAGSGQRVVLPVRASDAVHGVRLEIDTRWVDGNGYRPVRVRLWTEPSIPSPRGRTFQVTLTPVIPAGRGARRAGTANPVVSKWSSVSVSESVRLEEGERYGEATMLIPQSSTWSALRIAVQEQGQLLWECSDSEGYELERAVEDWTEMAPSVLIVSRHVPKYSERSSRWLDDREKEQSSGEASREKQGLLPQFPELAFQFGLQRSGLPLQETAGPWTDEDLGRLAEQSAKYEFVALDDIPDHWIGLSCVDFIFIEWRDVRALAAEAPEKWNAMRAWMEGGQTLFVHGIDDRFAELSELEPLLGLRGSDLAMTPEAARHGLMESEGSVAAEADAEDAVEEDAVEEDADAEDADAEDAVGEESAAVEGEGNEVDPEEERIPGDLAAASLRRRGWMPPRESDWNSIPVLRLGPFRMGDAAGIGDQEEEWLTVRFLDQLSPNFALMSGGLSHDLRLGSNEVREQSSGFRLREVGLGRVVAVTGPDPFLPRERLAWMVNSLESKRWSWGQRHGFSLRRDNPDLRPFQVPGLGEPPRVTFLLLITLFALAIGPLNYWALWRIRRLHLLLVTVPLAACLVTVFLLVLVVIRDGFQPRVYARSLTWLDQRSGRGVTWSTRAYFASLPPSDGLRFSDRSLVYPLDVLVQPHPGMPANRSPSLQLRWQGEQHLRGSYLRPRRTQHYSVISAGSQSNRLNLESRGAGGWQVTNELGANLQFLLLCASPNEYYYSPALAVGETRLLAPRGDSDARSQLLGIFQDFDDPLTSGTARRTSSNWPTIDSTVTEPRLTTGIMETLLNEIRTQPERVLSPGQYLAVVDWPDWMDLGLVEARREPSLHVVWGSFD
jgi:hypothetical protein